MRGGRFRRVQVSDKIRKVKVLKAVLNFLDALKQRSLRFSLFSYHHVSMVVRDLT